VPFLFLSCMMRSLRHIFPESVFVQLCSYLHAALSMNIFPESVLYFSALIGLLVSFRTVPHGSVLSFRFLSCMMRSLRNIFPESVFVLLRCYLHSAVSMGIFPESVFLVSCSYRFACVFPDSAPCECPVISLP
jgi:hypothetical protein